MVKNGKKRSFLSRLEQNGYLISNQRAQKHNCHFIDPKNFDQALIVLKKLAFYSLKYEQKWSKSRKLPTFGHFDYLFRN